MSKPTVHIKLVSVDFVPTWQMDEHDAQHTVIGQLSIDADELPAELRQHLVEICRIAMESYLRGKQLSSQEET